MSVIAKMNVVDVRDFGPINLVKLSCVYENDGLNGQGYEDRRFTKATPWGEGDLGTPHDRFVAPKKGEGVIEQQALYLVFTKANDPGNVYKGRSDCLFAMFVRVSYVETWPGTKHIQFTKDKSWDTGNPKGALNLRMAIDNPAASDQFQEGVTYYMAVYDAAKTTLQEAAAGA